MLALASWAVHGAGASTAHIIACPGLLNARAAVSHKLGLGTSVLAASDDPMADRNRDFAYCDDSRAWHTPQKVGKETDQDHAARCAEALQKQRTQTWGPAALRIAQELVGGNFCFQHMGFTAQLSEKVSAPGSICIGAEMAPDQQTFFVHPDTGMLKNGIAAAAILTNLLQMPGESERARSYSVGTPLPDRRRSVQKTIQEHDIFDPAVLSYIPTRDMTLDLMQACVFTHGSLRGGLKQTQLIYCRSERSMRTGEYQAMPHFQEIVKRYDELGKPE